jgi:hypothetical protein
MTDISVTYSVSEPKLREASKGWTMGPNRKGKADNKLPYSKTGKKDARSPCQGGAQLPELHRDLARGGPRTCLLELRPVVVDLPLLVIHEAVEESSSVSHYYSDRPIDEPMKNSLLLRV